MTRQSFIATLVGAIVAPFVTATKAGKVGYINAHKANDACDYRVINADTGEEILHCFEANDITGEYGVYVQKDGSYYMTSEHEIASEQHTGNIEIRLAVDSDREAFLQGLKRTGTNQLLQGNVATS